MGACELQHSRIIIESMIFMKTFRPLWACELQHTSLHHNINQRSFVPYGAYELQHVYGGTNTKYF